MAIFKRSKKSKINPSTKQRKPKKFQAKIENMYKAWLRTGFVFRFFLGIILLVFLVFIYLMARQAKIVQKGYNNSLREIEINRINVEMVQRQEEISRNLDYNTLRDRANNAGLSLPQESQVMAIHVNKRNFVTLTDSEQSKEGIIDFELQEAMLEVGKFYEKLEANLKEGKIKTQESVVKEQEEEDEKLKKASLERIEEELKRQQKEVDEKKKKEKASVSDAATEAEENSRKDAEQIDPAILQKPGMRGVNE